MQRKQWVQSDVNINYFIQCKNGLFLKYFVNILRTIIFMYYLFKKEKK